jgi:type I restriction enzyme S subunit
MQLPPEWDSERLDAVASIVTGTTPSPSVPAYYGSHAMFVTPADLGSVKYVRQSRRRLSAKGLAQARLVPAGSTLFVCIGSTIGKIGLTVESVATNQQINALVPNGHVNGEYPYYAAMNLSRVVRERASEQAVPLVNKTELSGYTISLPPRAEQAQIAGALADADALIVALERLLSKKQDIKQGIAQELLSGRTRLPGFTSGWQMARLSEVLTVRHGRNQRAVERPTGKYPILATGGQIGWTDMPLYTKPSVLIGRKGTLDRPQYQDQPFWTVDTLFYTEIAKIADPRFLYYVFQTIDWRLMSEASGVPSLNASRIESVKVALPELTEQIAIRQVLADADAEVDVLKHRLAKSRAIKEGMAQQLLTGRIRLPDLEPVA